MGSRGGPPVREIGITAGAEEGPGGSVSAPGPGRDPRGCSRRKRPTCGARTGPGGPSSQSRPGRGEEGVRGPGAGGEREAGPGERRSRRGCGAGAGAGAAEAAGGLRACFGR